MQEANNLQAKLSPQSQSQNPYYPPYNPQGGYPQSHSNQDSQGQNAYPDQAPSGIQQNELNKITTSMNTNYGCYVCLLYFELVVSILAVISIIFVDSGLGEPAYIAIDVVLTLPILVGCILALHSKSNGDKGKQKVAYILFIVATCLSVVQTILLAIWTEGAITVIIGGVIRTLIGFYLTFSAYSLLQLMRKRDYIVSRQLIVMA